MIRKHILLAAGAATAALALAGTAVAAGPPANAPRLGAQQGYGVMTGAVVMDAAADYIGISETALAAARHDGKSLAQIAVASGKTAAGLQDALVTAFKTNLAKLVAAGRLTDAQSAQALANFQAQVKTTIERTAIGPMAGRGAGAGRGLGMGTCGGRR